MFLFTVDQVHHKAYNYTERLEQGRNLHTALDSLMNLHDGIWIVNDYWGGPRTSGDIADYRVLSEIWISHAIEVVHISK